MTSLTRWVLRHRWWVLGGWLLLAVVGGIAAPRATAALSYDFSLPGQPGYETNAELEATLGSGGANAPVLLLTDAAADPAPVVAAVTRAVPGARVASYADHPELRAGGTGVVLVYPRPVPGGEAYAAALPALQAATADLGVTVTGPDALAADGGGGGASVLVETIAGGTGALVVLALVFGSLLALLPLAIAVASILTTFLIVWGLTGITDVSFIVQFLLALIGLGVAIDYALLVVTRWREESRAHDPDAALERAMATAGRSVVFSGVTVAVSLAALIALPVPFLRSIGFTGLLIPLVSVAAAVTLLPALLAVAGRRLDWPHRRTADPESRLWRWVGGVVVRHRWVAAVGAVVVLLLLAAPVLGLRLGAPTNASLASVGGPAADGLTRLSAAGLGDGLTQPVEILTTDPARVRAAVAAVPGVAAAITPSGWTAGDLAVVEAWTTADASGPEGSAAAAEVRATAEGLGARVGGIPAQDADFVTAVYGNAWWVVLVIVVVTFLLLARALRSVVLPVKALLLNVLSLGAAYGVTVLVWQDGFGTELLFRQSESGAVTVWVPIAVFAFLFGLSMDYEVFLLSRIREEYDATGDTDEATVHGVARTGRLVTSAAVILFLAFVSLSTVPSTDVKILATALALGIVLDATIVRGVLAPALVAGFGRANWWWPRRDR